MCTNMSDPACKQQMMAHREIQIETPFGEMDMEPGEMDLEGVAAHQLLKQIGIGGPNMNPVMQEINLNQNVLRALKQRFGVNTTAGIRRMSSNPEFQAFMYRVLTHSAPVAPGEYNANLTQAEVNWILNDLSASSGTHRLSTGKLDDAQLNTQNATSGSGKKSTVLTINGPNTNPWANMGMMGQLPGFAAQTQEASAAQAIHKPGVVQALVQGMLTGEGSEGIVGGEAGEVGEEKKKKGNETQVGEAGEAPAGQPTAASGAANSASAAGLTAANPETSGIEPVASMAPGTTLNTAINQGNLAPSPSTLGKEADIVGKDGKFGISKDQRRRNEKLLAEQLEAAGAGAGAGTNMEGAQASIPIGIQEAGLESLAVTNTTLEPPVKALPSGYASSTAFAIAAITLIVLAIIVGPILCYLCKLREKREEKLRKQKAMKNREVSENNIMESMVLHDFGREAQTVSNDGASPYGERYTTLDSDLEEIERYKKAGFLP